MAMMTRVHAHLTAAAGPGEALSASSLKLLGRGPGSRTPGAAYGPSLLRPATFVPLLRGISMLCEYNDVVKVGNTPL